MLFKKAKCPKCDSRNTNIVKESFIKNLKRSLFNFMFPIRLFIGTGRKPNDLFVCKDCGFTMGVR